MVRSLDKSIIIFDGECNLCNGVVGWLIQAGASDFFHYVPFQSSSGQKILSNHGFKTDALETVVLIDEKGIHTLSDGFIKIIAKVPKWKRSAWLLSLPPKFVRDNFYRFAAKNRIKWFGKSSFCRLNP